MCPTRYIHVVCPYLQPPLTSPLNHLNPLPSILGKRLRPLCIIPSPRTTSLPPSKPGRNALHNHGSPECKERIAPRHVRARLVPGRLGVPLNALLTPRQPCNRPGSKQRQLTVRTVHDVRAREVTEVGEGVSYGRHLPVQHANHPRLRLVEDHVVDFVVAVHEGAAVERLRALLREEGDHVVEVGKFADGLFGVDVDDGRLRFGDCREGFNLAVEEACRLAEGFEADALGVYVVELGERSHCIFPAVWLVSNEGFPLAG
jgi:hypothetical protein